MKKDKNKLNESLFHLPDTGLTKEQHKQSLDEFSHYITRQQNNFLGYQVSQTMEYLEDTKQFLNSHINNVGDPFSCGNLTVNSKVMEKAVLDYYAKLWNARTPHDPIKKESYWGYILTMGSSEGNIYGLWNARDYLKGRKLIVDTVLKKVNRKEQRYLQAKLPVDNDFALTPVAFFSEDTHYSIIKFMRVLQIPTYDEIGEKYFPGQNPITDDGQWSASEVPSEGGKFGPGSIDIDKLETLVEFFASRGFAILINCNYGSTFKGAYDDVDQIGQRLMPIFEKHDLVDRKIEYEDGHFDIRNGYWIHVDGALGASYMPFIEMACDKDMVGAMCKGPTFDFRLPWVNSIVMSGHKWPSAPWPCGVFMTKVKYQLFPPDDPEYIGSPDTTFAGSRNGFSAIIMWEYLAKNSYESQIKRALRCEYLAGYAESRLNDLQALKPELDLYIARTPLSLTVRFRQPNDSIVEKYSLSCQTMDDNGSTRHYAHIFLMDNTGEAIVDQLIDDLNSPDAFQEKTRSRFHILGKGLGLR